MIAQGSGSSLWASFLSLVFSSVTAGIRNRFGDLGNAWFRKIWILFFASVMRLLE